MEEMFTAWVDDDRRTLGLRIAPFLVQHGATLFHVGPPGEPYRKEIRAGWQGSRENKLLGILKPARRGVKLELRVGPRAATQLIAAHDDVTAPNDGSSNAADKVIIQVEGTELPNDFQAWIALAYAFAAQTPVPA